MATKRILLSEPVVPSIDPKAFIVLLMAASRDGDYAVCHGRRMASRCVQGARRRRLTEAAASLNRSADRRKPTGKPGLPGPATGRRH